MKRNRNTTEAKQRLTPNSISAEGRGERKRRTLLSLLFRSCPAQYTLCLLLWPCEAWHEDEERSTERPQREWEWYRELLCNGRAEEKRGRGRGYISALSHILICISLLPRLSSYHSLKAWRLYSEADREQSCVEEAMKINILGGPLSLFQCMPQRENQPQINLWRNSMKKYHREETSASWREEEEENGLYFYSKKSWL